MKIAVIGTGNIGERHIKTINSLDDVEPIAIPIRKERLAELTTQGINVSQNIQEAIDQGASAAIIATDTGRHEKDAIECLRHGLDTLIEKPMAINAISAQNICDTAYQTDGHVYVGCILRFSESLNAFRQKLNLVGDLHSVQVQCKSYLPMWRPSQSYLESYSARLHEGGAALDLIHEIDYIGWIYGWPKEVQAMTLNTGRLNIQAEEIVEAFWKSPEASIISLSLDYLSHPPSRTMSAYGSKGTIKWDGIRNKLTLNLIEAEEQIINYDQSADTMLKDEIHSFIEAVNGRTDIRLTTGMQGIRALEVIDAIKLSTVTTKAEPVG